MMNYRTKNKCLYQLKLLVKRVVFIFSENYLSLPILKINKSNVDKFGNTIIRGRKNIHRKRRRKRIFLYRLLIDDKCKEKLIPNRRYHNSAITRRFNKPQISGKLIKISGITYRII